MAFTEFYCNASTGSNINAGDLTANGVVTSTNGDWDNAAANRFTAASGTPFSGVSVGEFASVYLDGATVAVYIGRVTAVNGGGASLDISATVKSGTKPTAGATGRSCTTGGAWKGPNGTSGFPFNFIDNALVNTSSDSPRVNMLDTTQYDVTAAITHSTNGVRFEGYTSTVGDGGKATIDGGGTGASYIVLTASGQGTLANLIFARNGSTGTATGVVISGNIQCQRVVVHSMKGVGLSPTSGGATLVECEAYSNGSHGFGTGVASSIGRFIRCVAIGNTGSGFSILLTGAIISYTILDCIASGNTSYGVLIQTSTGTVTSSLLLRGCELYNNGSTGLYINWTSTGGFIGHVENCNFVKNGGYGLDAATLTALRHLSVRNNGFGAGTQANTSGATNGLIGNGAVGSVTYASNVTPWVDPANGDFRINLAAAINAGRGSFTETNPALSAPNTVGYPDIGAAQHQESGGSASGVRNPLRGPVG